ncbi:MAG: hypothetical protein WC475_02775 [Candidatus Paceibacterota bacterium]
MKKILKYFVLVSAASLIAVNFASAEQPANLQQSFDQIKESVQEVKEGTKNLITTKESENLSPEEKEKQELSQRLDIFAKILDLSVKEAKDTISQLKALKNIEEKYVSSQEEFVKKFENFLKFYNEQEGIAGKPEEIDLAKIKEMAQSFKDWRETTYNPEFAAVTDFILVNRQKTTLEMAGNRFAKISSDVAKLKKTNLKGVDGLEKLLNLAADSLKEAKDFYQEAKDGFWLLEEKLSAASSTTASSTLATGTSTPVATSTEEIIVPEISVSAENASSTSDTASTSTPSISIEDQFLSIKGLVGNSLNKIKETYQIFIEMSNFVKKLLI